MHSYVTSKSSNIYTRYFTLCMKVYAVKYIYIE